jgi:hypothetical protein
VGEDISRTEFERFHGTGNKELYKNLFNLFSEARSEEFATDSEKVIELYEILVFLTLRIQLLFEPIN